MYLWSLFKAEMRFDELRAEMKKIEGYSVRIPSAVFNWALENGLVSDEEYHQAEAWFEHQWNAVYFTYNGAFYSFD